MVWHSYETVLLLESLFPLLPALLMSQEWSTSSLPMKMGSCAPAKCPQGPSVASPAGCKPIPLGTNQIDLPKVLAKWTESPQNWVFWGVWQRITYHLYKTASHMTYVWSSISSLEGECRVASPSRQLWQFPHTFIVIVVITGNTYRCQHHSPTFNVRIYLQNPSKKSTYVHSFTNLLTHTHIYIYVYITHTIYIISYTILSYILTNISKFTARTLARRALASPAGSHSSSLAMWGMGWPSSGRRGHTPRWLRGVGKPWFSPSKKFP